MKGVKCPKCGRASDGLCPNCYINSHPLRVKPTSYRLCQCGLIFFKGRWYDDPGQLYHDVAVKSIKPPSGVKITKYDVKVQDKAGKKVFDVRAHCLYGKTRFKKEIKWEIKPSKTACEECRRLNTGYYEAVLQLRDEKLDPELDERKIAKKEKVKGGGDVYLTSLEYAREVVGGLKETGYIVKESSKLYGKKNGKDAYRHYFSIKHPSVNEGDFVVYKGHPVRVLEVGKNVKIQDLSTGKVKNAKLNHIEESEVVGGKMDEKPAIVTEIRPDGIQIMDSQDYETHNIKRRDSLIQGQEIKYFKYGRKYYIL